MRVGIITFATKKLEQCVLEGAGNRSGGKRPCIHAICLLSSIILMDMPLLLAEGFYRGGKECPGKVSS
jgi:hypothetical protein